ncbi:MAG: mechanosensitive ion channel domain-containing protein [Patescibacteria group bacterium]
MNLIPVALAATKAEDPVVPTFLSNIAVGLVVLVVTYFLATFLRSWVQRIIRAKQGEGHEEARVLYGRMVFTITLFVGITISLIIMGVPLEWFSGGVGLGVAFALRSFIANFFAGVVLLSNNKFNLGDWVIVNPGDNGKSSITGRIVDIQSRATSIRAIDGGEITIPNLKMIESAVKCYTHNPIRRHTIEMSMGYGADINQASELMRKVVMAHPSVQPEPKVIVLITEVADSDIVLQARFWTETRSKWWIVKSELTRDVFNAFCEAGIDIPYPIQTLRVDDASSDLLAKDARFLAKLDQIEKEKAEANAEVNAAANVATKTEPAIKAKTVAQIEQDTEKVFIPTPQNS